MTKITDKVEVVIGNYRGLFDRVYDLVGGQNARGVNVVLNEPEKPVRWGQTAIGYNSPIVPLHTKIIIGIGSQPLMLCGWQYRQKLRGYIEYDSELIKSNEQGVIQIYKVELYELIDGSFTGMPYEEKKYNLLLEYIPHETVFTQRDHFLKKRQWKVSQGWRALDDSLEDFVSLEVFLKRHYHNHLAGNGAKFEQLLVMIVP